MSAKYQEFSGLNLPAIEKEILQSWQENGAFEKSVSLREGAQPFVFYEGPPSANGMPGIHHVISRTLKDLVCRYKTMQGFQVKRKGGWDTHGLPVELGVEKELGITKEDIGKKISVEDYNQKCREAVLRYKKEWDDLTTKMGYWVDLNDPYITFENNYIESLWWILKKLYDRNLLYESVSIQPYSPAAGTGLSSHELNQPGTYKDVKDTSAVAMFKAIENEKLKIKNVDGEIFFLAWTTTPWTLPSNLGLTVGPNIDYVLVKLWNDYSKEWFNGIIAKQLLKNYLSEKYLEKLVIEIIYQGVINSGISGSKKSQTDGHAYLDNKLYQIEIKVENVNEEAINKFQNYISESGSFGGIFFTINPIDKKLEEKFPNIIFRNYSENILAEFKGKDLEGISYEQLLPYEANKIDNPNSFKILLGDFVTTEDGTGIVHTAPAFGADDFRVGKKYDIGILTMVDKLGKFVDGLGEFSNRYVKNYKSEKNYVDVNVDICVKLKKENRAFKVEKYEHSYPHCWRTDKPILYYPLDAWFIKTTALKDRMVELNKTINWKPKSTGEGRFGNWLENMVDWNLSRSRFWGTPLPVWKSYTKRYSEPLIYDSEDLKYYDEVCVGNKIELLKTKSKKGRDVSGYKIDLKKISIDLLLEDSPIVLSILNHNKEILESFNRHKNSGDPKFLDETFFNWSDYFKLFGIDLDKLKNIVSNKIISANELSEFNFIRFDTLKEYCLELSNNDLQNFDFHKPFIDEIIFASPKGRLFARVPDLIDVWFDSGAMPYAQWHFPFENVKTFSENYPADFIAEGVDQTRGWFYTLHAIGSLIKESVVDELQKANLPTGKVDGRAYKTVVSNGLVLDKNGVKMSKRLGNIVDPFKTIETFGADATRWYLITNASPWDNLKFDLEGIKEVQRKFFGTLYNTYQFFALYANVDGFSFSEKYIPLNDRPEIDRWILSSLNTLIKKVIAAMDDYEPTQAGRLMEEFVDEHLSNWYVRLCRRRFWKGEYEQDKISAYQTLYECLETLTRLIAPISPFFSDAVFKNLEAVTNKFKVESVHHTGFPKVNENVIDVDLEERMQLAQDASSLILSLRKKVNIKVRQPLQKVLIPFMNISMLNQLQSVEGIIKSETNIKELQYLNPENNFIKKRAKANFKTLGKRLGGKMKWAAEEISKMNDISIGLVNGGYLLNPDFIEKNEDAIIINTEDIEVTTDQIAGYEIASKGNLTVALDITISPELLQEGEAREFVNRIQNIRKDSGFALTDKILVEVFAPETINRSLIEFKNYICAEILADNLSFVPVLEGGTEIEVNDDLLKVSITKKG
jgi:isoleucyl-tRNA synthetase